MSDEALAKILDEVMALTAGEQRQVREALDEILRGVDEDEKLNAFHRAMLSSGLVKEIKTPQTAGGAERRLVEVRGKPLSETIVEERR